MDTYKNSGKDEIMDWITTLKKCGTAHDWMVVLVETPESRKGANKLLPRTSVVDRLRTDVGTKFSDRCLTLTGKPDICLFVSNRCLLGGRKVDILSLGILPHI